MGAFITCLNLDPLNWTRHYEAKGKEKNPADVWDGISVAMWSDDT